ncbi:MAG: tetratricopeptide repeat protein, partial [Deltaproteobacteria bacterium]
ERFLTAPWLILKHLFLLLAPVNLSAEYMISPIKSISSFPFIISFLIVISALTIAFINREKNISFGIIFFVVALIPVLNLMSLGNPFAERYLYLPTVGFSVVAWIVVAHLFKKKKNLYLLITFLILLAIYSLAVIKRNAVWHDNLLLWSDTVKKVPKSDRIHNNLGIEYEKRNRLDEAEQHYITALRLKPDFAEAYTNLSLVYLKRGWLDDAQQAAISALKLNHNYMYAHYNLGLIYIKMGLKDEARKEFETTLKLSPGDRGAQKILETLD